MNTEQPHGLIVAPSLHLVLDWPKPACDDDRVEALVDAAMATHVPGGTWDPIGGYAEGRPVCRHCIRRVAFVAKMRADNVARAEAHNAALGAVS